MAGITDLERNITRLEEATENARAATREAHAARQDLDVALRDARALLTKTIKAAVDDAITDAIKVGLDEMGDSIRTATNDCYDRVGRQVDMLVNLMLGKPGAVGKREDLRPLLAEKMREWITDEIAKV